MIDRVGSLAAVLFVLVAAACGRSPDLASARSAVLAADSAWEAAASEGEDLDRIVSYLAEDAVMIPPSEPVVRGRDAIRAYMAQGYETPGFAVEWETLEARVGPSGDLAYLTQRNRFTARNEEGETLRFQGRGVTIWERDESEEWRVVLYIWNEETTTRLRRVQAGTS